MLRGFSVPLTPHAAGDLSAALASALGPLASALRTLRPPQAIPALRPVQPASRGTPLAAITDGLVEATDTLDSVLRKTSRSPRPRPNDLVPRTQRSGALGLACLVCVWAASSRAHFRAGGAAAAEASPRRTSGGIGASR